MDLSAFEHLGDPTEEEPPTKKQQQAQHASFEMQAWVRAQVAQAPPLRPEQIERLRHLLFGSRAQPHELMRWQVRLFCGHLVERRAHISHRTTAAALSASASCPTCGLEPATILAARPLGPAGPPPAPMRQGPAPDRARLQQRAERLEREAADLRRQLRVLEDE